MKNLLSIINKEIPSYINILRKNTEVEILDSIRRLLNIMEHCNPNFLDSIYDEWLEDEKKEYWYALFHKSLRQCDAFTDCHSVRKTINPLSEEKEKRYKELVINLNKSVKLVNDDKWPLSFREWQDNNSELISEKRRLKAEKYTSTNEEISGDLDMILHNLINIDTTNRFSFVLDSIFTDIKENFLKT